jgi:hypothetical protein
MPVMWSCNDWYKRLCCFENANQWRELTVLRISAEEIVLSEGKNDVFKFCKRNERSLMTLIRTLIGLTDRPTNEPTNQPTKLISGSRGLLVNLIVADLVKKFPTFYGTRRFITVFVGVRHWYLSWAIWIQFTSTQSESKRPLGRPRRRWEDNINLRWTVGSWVSMWRTGFGWLRMIGSCDVLLWIR